MYTKNIHEILQRELKENRISQISNYLLNNNERFFNSLIVAIHKGTPKWSDFDIETHFKIDNKIVDDSNLEFIKNKLGVLTLSGNEEIFTLDGQHRLKGIRRALKTNLSLNDEECSLIFVVHNNKAKERTRRLFTVLNKYAEKPRGAELIILDEDDVRAIVSRKLATNHKVLNKPNGLSISNTGSIPPTDDKSFTTLVTINNINSILFRFKRDYYTQRPDDSTIEKLYEVSANFWDILFSVFPELVEFIDGKEVNINNKPVRRNKITGGSLLLRPVGQELIAKNYKEFEKRGKLDKLKNNLRKIDFDLNGPTWKYIFWNSPKMIPKEEELKNYLIPYLLGDPTNEEEIQSSIKRIYKSFNLEYKNHIKPII